MCFPSDASFIRGDIFLNVAVSSAVCQECCMLSVIIIYNDELTLSIVHVIVGDGLEFKVGGDGAIAGAKKALPTGTTRK